ncbi:MAG TPA: GatB/YqeY domain-containing protein [Desulfopila sp.]|nr:GatB/YqeY domain-containing protein [Desulfopila sp.]
MALQQKIQAELKVAMKAKDKERTGVIRILIGEFQRQPDKDLSDDQVVGIIKKLIKSERELLAASGGEESGYITVLESYLPQQASEEDIRSWIRESVDLAAMGNKMQAMRPIMAHFGSRADGNVVKKILQEMD